MIRLLSLLLLSLLSPALAQSSSTSSFEPGPRTSAAATSTTPSSAAIATTPTPTPSLIFVPISPVTACGSARADGRIQWQLYNEDPAQYDITLSVLNLGVDQSIPISTSTPASSSSSSSSSSAAATSSVAPSSAAAASSSPTSAGDVSGPIFTFTPAATSSAASTSFGIGFVLPRRHTLEARTDLEINATVVVQNANVGFTWSPIGLPEGRYFLIGNVNDPYNTSGVSTIFTVLNGTDMDCLASSNLTDGAFAPAGASTTSQSVSPSATLAAASTGGGGGGIGTGGIVGLVVGIIVGMGLVGLVVWCCIRRKRRAAPAGGDMEEHKSAFAWPSARVSSERSGQRSSQDHGPNIGQPQATFVSRPIDGRSIRSSRPDSIGSMPLQTATGSDESFHTPEMGSNPFMTPQATPLRDRDTAPLAAAGSAAAVAAGAGAGVARPESTFNPDPSARELRRASSPVTYLPPMPFPSGSNSPPRSDSQDGSNGLTRSKSNGEVGARTGSKGKNGTAAEMRRAGSSRRKPVPSLGADLRGELERQRSDQNGKGMSREGSSSEGSIEEGNRKSYQLVPDLPLRQD